VHGRAVHRTGRCPKPNNAGGNAGGESVAVRWAGAIARFSGEQKARRIARTLENARRGFWYPHLVDLVEARRYPPAVFERAERLLSALDAERGRDALERLG
jgi:hypothetical protein